VKSLGGVAAAAAAGFAALGTIVALDAHVPGEISADRDLHRALASSATTTLMKAVTFVGGPTIVLPVALVVGGWLFYRRRAHDGLFLLGAVAGAYVLEETAKAAWHRARPDLWPSLAHARGYAFPSGHATGSIAFALAIAVLAWSTRWGRLALGVGVAFALAVGLSRVYLGVHYPSDVAAGWLLGTAWVTVLAAMTRFARRRAS
jgi:undecaprenyl-diphosphatase